MRRWGNNMVRWCGALELVRFRPPNHGGAAPPPGGWLSSDFVPHWSVLVLDLHCSSKTITDASKGMNVELSLKVKPNLWSTGGALLRALEG